MANSIQHDNLQRRLVAKYEVKRQLLRALIRDTEVNQTLRFRAVQTLTRLPRGSSLVRVRARCVQTGRGRSTMQTLKLSRICIRELAHQGLLPGIKKSSW